ncbi:hypothetical protein Q1695_000368 [Nippostrongylus brasiliensis]|nr:hypothetical protein Q1695_000368 [Nippostrongylus brasiliensis]
MIMKRGQMKAGGNERSKAGNRRPRVGPSAISQLRHHFACPLPHFSHCSNVLTYVCERIITQRMDRRTGERTGSRVRHGMLCSFNHRHDIERSQLPTIYYRQAIWRPTTAPTHNRIRPSPLHLVRTDRPFLCRIGPTGIRFYLWRCCCCLREPEVSAHAHAHHLLIKPCHCVPCLVRLPAFSANDTASAISQQQRKG